MIELLLIGALISGLIGALMASHKGMGALTGFLIGLPFGIFGLAYIALQPEAD